MKEILLKDSFKEIKFSIEIAESFERRLIGLMFQKGLDENTGLLITRCNSIHTFFMRFPIDVIFLNEKYEIIKIIENLKPWRFTRMYFKATQVLEINGGELSKYYKNLKELEVQCIN